LVRAVVDTNVLVSGLIKQGTPPAEVVTDVLAGLLVPLYDQWIIDEYQEVLARPKLKIPTEKVDAFLEFIVVDGIEVHDAPICFPRSLLERPGVATRASEDACS